MTSNSQQPLVEITNVTYTHWNQTKPSLLDISLTVYPGTLNVLVGPSGSGKSTLCDLFNGVIPHLRGGKFEGSVLIAGKDSKVTPVKDLALSVGRVFQDPETMFATLYVEDEIAFGPENLRFAVPDIRTTVETLLESSGLTDHRHNLVWNLSGGQVQKLGIATVLAMHPRMIVLDEPTANLDPSASHSVHEQLLELRKQGVTVILVTRELDEFLAEADQLVVLNEGTIVAVGTPRDVLTQHGTMMNKELGVWLPETSEIGIDLRDAGLLHTEMVPITVNETVEVLANAGLVGSSLVGNLTQPPRIGSEVLISASDLRYTYPGGIMALDGVSLDVHAGEWIAIVGRNGAGKSTLARMLVGLLKVQDGDLMLFGKPANRWKVQDLANHIALVFQNPEHQFLTDTVEEEIGYSLLAQGVVDQQEIHTSTLHMMRLLGLEDSATMHPFALSAGLKRRLGVATMLVGNPRVLLVDEPTYGQDKKMTGTLMELMSDIRSRGIAVVMITHDMRLVQEYADRVVVMAQGNILYDGGMSGLFERGEILREANLRPTILHGLIGAIRARGIPVQGEIRRTSDLVEALKTKPQGARHGR